MKRKPKEKEKEKKKRGSFTAETNGWQKEKKMVGVAY